MTPEFLSLLPRFLEGGIRDMVDHGGVREALLPALTSVGSSGTAVWDVAAPPDRAAVEDLANRGLRRAGISPGTWPDRVATLEQLAGDVIEVASQWSRAPMSR